MFYAIGFSLLSGIIAVTLKSTSRMNLRKRLIQVMLACGIVTKTDKKKLFPRIIEEHKKEYGRQFKVQLPDGYPSDVVIEKWWIPFEEALKRELSLSFDQYLIIDVFEKRTPKMIEWREEFVKL